MCAIQQTLFIPPNKYLGKMHKQVKALIPAKFWQQ